MDHHRELYLFLQGLHQIVGLGGAHDAGHILDGDGLDAQLLHLQANLHIVFQVVDGADGIADGAGGDGPRLEGLIHRHLDVFHIVQGVEDTDDIHAVFHRLADEHPHHIVGIVLIAQDVLAPQQHLELGVGAGGADLPQPLPGVLVQIPQAGIEGGPAPALQGIIPCLVQLAQNRLELPEGEPGGDEGLVCVPKDGFCESNFHTNTSIY